MKTRIIGICVLTALILSSCGSNSGIDTNMIPVSVDGKTLYLDPKGKTVLESEETSRSFSNGLAYFYGKSGYGYVNKSGKVVIEPEFKSVTLFSEDIAWVTKEGGHPEAINESGKVKFTLEQAQVVHSFSDGQAVFETYDAEGKTLYGCVNKSGKVVIEPQPNKISSFSEGMAVVTDHDTYKKGYINKSGEIVINCQFDDAADFKSTGLACVEFGDKWGVINSKGEYVINPQFDKILADGKWFMIADNKKVGWCDQDGKYVINPQFSTSLFFGDNDLAPVCEGKKWGYVNRKGLVQISYQFDKAFPFINNKTAIVALNDKMGIIDSDGKYIVNPQYDKVDSDYIESLVMGKVSHSLYTDYFNTEEIVAKVKELITNDGIYGVSYNSNMGALLEKYALKQSTFPKRSAWVQLSKSKYSGDVDISFNVYGMPWVSQRQGWFSSYVFSSQYQPQSYSIILDLSWRKSDKANELARQIYKALGGTDSYPEDINEPTASDIQTPNYVIDVSDHEKKVTIVVRPVRS